MNITTLSKAARYVLIAGAAILISASAVFAQNAPLATTTTSAQSAQPSVVKLGEISVTGTAIPRTSIETPSPVTVITAKQIQESGFTTISDVVRSIAADNSGTIPMAFTDGFAGGSTGVALRGLTVNSTLVLIDGRRTAAYALADDGERSFTDLSTIPLNAVERIEVLKDGASSIYGADAIAGVVNIILYPSYHGSKATIEVGTSQHGGGTMTRATIISGTGDLETDHYNAYVSLEYENDNPIYNSERGFPYSACDLTSVGSFNNCVGGQAAGASIYGSVAPATVSLNPDGSPNLLSGVQIPGTTSQLLRPCGPGSTPVNYPGTGPGTGPACEYNQISQYGQIQPQTTSWGLDGRITLNINDNTQAYINASYDQMRMVSSQFGFPSIQTSTPVNTNNIALPPTLPGGGLNPNDPFANATCAATTGGCPYALIGYNFSDLPNAFSTTTVNHNLRLVTDINGAFGNSGWNYDGAVTINHTWLNDNLYGMLYYPALINAVTDGTYNFVNPAANSQAVRNALSPVDAKTSTTDMDSLDFSVNRSLTDLPGGPLGLALGGQWRYEAQDDPSLNPGNNYQGLGSAQTIGHRNVAAAFFELDAPVLESLEIDASGREDHYSDFGSAFSPKIGFKWTPIKQLAIRGTYSRGFRAPAFAENGSSSSLGFITEAPPASFQAQHPCNTPGCTGPDPYAQPYGLGLLSAANPNIKPERSRNYTFGFVFQPTEGFSGTMDYYNILKTNVIAPPAPGAAIGQYFATGTVPAGTSVILDLPDPLYPTAMLRPIQFNANYLNENELRTSGVDLGLDYKLGFSSGLNWESAFNATKIIQWEETLTQGGPLVSMVGTQGPYELSSGAGTPQYRANWANSFSFGPATITGTLYYVSGMYMYIPDALPANLCYSSFFTPTGNNLPADCHVASFTYLDLTGSYKLGSDWTLTAGILNALDRKAPFDPINYAGNNYNPTYNMSGVIGRFFQLGLQVRF